MSVTLALLLGMVLPERFRAGISSFRHWPAFKAMATPLAQTDKCRSAWPRLGRRVDSPRRPNPALYTQTRRAPLGLAHVSTRIPKIHAVLKRVPAAARSAWRALAWTAGAPHT